MVISKYNFSEVFAEAWLKALTPVNIVSGFRKCGIYPFNRDAIPVSDEQDESEPPANEELDSSPVNAESTRTTSPLVNFTDDQIDLFTRRLEEGYDLFDPQYVQWLKLNHPLAVPADDDAFGFDGTLSDHFTDVRPLVPVPVSPASVLGGCTGAGSSIGSTQGATPHRFSSNCESSSQQHIETTPQHVHPSGAPFVMASSLRQSDSAPTPSRNLLSSNVSSGLAILLCRNQGNSK